MGEKNDYTKINFQEKVVCSMSLFLSVNRKYRKITI